MTYYARVINDIVIEVIETDNDPAEMFVDEIASQFVECDATTEQGFVFDGQVFSEPPIVIADISDIKKRQLKTEMYRILADGFTWKATNPDPWFTVCIDADMQGFLTRTLLKMNEGRINPHGGFIRSNGVSTLIDDTGMRELCVFAGMWGDAISAIRIQVLEAVADWEAFDPYDVDWSVNWSGDDASNGWTDNTLTQAP